MAYLGHIISNKTRNCLAPILLWTLVFCPAGCAKDNSTTPGNGDNGNSVVVTSVSAARGEAGVMIPVRLTNDVSLRAAVVPLALRQAGSDAFVTSLKLSFGDRLQPWGALGEVRFTNHYYNEDGTCKSNQAGGFGTIALNDTLAHPIGGAPVGLLFFLTKVLGAELPPGADDAGSLILTVNVNDASGTFEIDSTCANPANHLMFISASNAAIVPAFTKGTVTIE